MNSKRQRKVKAFLDSQPTVACRGLCHRSCTVIGMTPTEFVQLTRVSGKEPKVTPDMKCNYLVDERCTVYENRPMVCRQFGTTERLPCPYGCQPSRMMSEAEGYEQLRRFSELCGDEPTAVKYNGTRKQIYDNYISEGIPADIAQSMLPPLSQEETKELCDSIMNQMQKS